MINVSNIEEWKKFNAAGWSWLLNPAVNWNNFSLHLAAPSDLLRPPAEPLTNDNPERGTYVVRVATPEISIAAIVIKRYRSKTIWRSLKYLLTKSPARRAFEKTLLMQAHAISTPATLAMGEMRRLGWLLESYLMMENMDGATSLRHIRRASSDRQVGVRLIRQLARLIAKFHNIGLIHSDPTLGNFLVRQPNALRPELIVIDLDGVRSVGTVSLRSAVGSLRLLLRRIRMSPRERIWFSAQYANDRKLSAHKLFQALKQQSCDHRESF